MLSLKKQSLIEFDSYLGSKGFNRHSDSFYGERYDRPIPGGRFSLSINWHLRKPVLVLDPASAGIRLDEVEHEVFRFEEPSELISEHDVLQRSTIAFRLAGNEVLNLLTNRYTISRESDCSAIAQKYIQNMFDKAERFWRKFASKEVIFDALSGIPAKARDSTRVEPFSSQRAVTLAKILKGPEIAERLGDQLLERLPDSSKKLFAEWLERAAQAWSKS